MMRMRMCVCICLGVQSSPCPHFLCPLYSLFSVVILLLLSIIPLCFLPFSPPFSVFFFSVHIFYTLLLLPPYYTHSNNSGQWFAAPLSSRSPLPHRCFLCIFTYHTLLKLFKKLSLTPLFPFSTHFSLFFVLQSLPFPHLIQNTMHTFISKCSNFLTLLQII